MKYQVGDTVILLHSGEEATIIEFLDKEMVNVDANGIQFPVYLDQIDFPYYYRFSKKYQKENHKSAISPKKFPLELPREKKISHQSQSIHENGVSLVFFPFFSDLNQDYLVERFKIYLNNEFTHPIQFNYQLKLNGRIDYSYEGTLEARQTFYLHDILMESFNDNPIFLFEIAKTENANKKSVHFSKTIKIKPKKLFTYLEDLRVQEKASFSIEIVKEFTNESTYTNLSEPINILSPVIKDYRIERSKYFEQSFQHIIDLHIEELVSDTKGMSNFEILRTQLNAFEKHFELAIQHHQPTITVIHGVGKGTLKVAIHEWLKDNPFVSHYSNQFDPFYGNGATTIHLRY